MLKFFFRKNKNNQSCDGKLYEMFMACYKGDVAKVRRLLKDSPLLIDKSYSNYSTPLSIATSVSRTEIVNVLLGYGAKMNTLDASGTSPLYTACLNGCYEIVKSLLQKGANIEILDSDHHSPLHAAIVGSNTKVVELLILNKANVNCCSFDGWTPLLTAINLKNEKAVDLLIKAGANLYSSTCQDDYPLLLAKDSTPEIFRTMLSVAEVDYATTSDNSLLISMIKDMTKTKTEIDYVLKMGASPDFSFQNCGWTPLFQAVASGRADIVYLLMGYGADTEIQYRNGDGVYRNLHYYCTDDLIKHYIELKRVVWSRNKPFLPKGLQI